MATLIVTAVLLALQAAHEVREDILNRSQYDAARIALHLNREVHEGFILPAVEKGEAIDLDDPRQLARLDLIVRLGISELDVRAVYLFDLEGRITYSTNLEHRGFAIRDNPNYRRALAGEVSSLLVARGNPLDVAGGAAAVNLLETYVPVHALDAAGQPGELVGVIEIYQDATNLVSETRAAMVNAALTSAGALGLLMLALWLWVRKADRIIEERTQALLAANARLEALSEDLERQVDDRTRRLVRAETLASLGTLAAGVAHEVNNPVAAIASSAEGLLRRAGRSESLREHPEFADFPDYLEIIRDEAFRVKSITRNLLDFSRTGEAEAREPVDLRALLQAAARLFEHRAAREDKTIALDLPEVPVVVTGDPARLRQVALNLTVNALEASRALVRWRLEQDSEAATLVCEDDGPGFTAEALERAMEPFFTNKPVGSGTGLGLSIAYGVVREHGGELKLGNRPSGGGAVRVTLPRAGHERGAEP
ncbi:MAG: sensor histidine kinase [Planctomycetota bacterium]